MDDRDAASSPAEVVDTNPATPGGSRPSGPLPRERFLVLGRSEIPNGKGSQFGSSPHPYVVSVSVSGTRPWVALSTGSGHLGAGAVFTIDYVLLPDGRLHADWRENVEEAGALWVVPHLAALLAGGTVTEDLLTDEYRTRHGVEPDVEMLPVRPGLTAEQLRAERKARQATTHRR